MAKVGDTEISGETFRTTYQYGAAAAHPPLAPVDHGASRPRLSGLDDAGAVAHGRPRRRSTRRRAISASGLRPAHRPHDLRGSDLSAGQRPVRPHPLRLATSASDGLNEQGSCASSTARSPACSSPTPSPARCRCRSRRRRRSTATAPSAAQPPTSILLPPASAGEIPAPTDDASSELLRGAQGRPSALRSTAPSTSIALYAGDARQAGARSPTRRPASATSRSRQAASARPSGGKIQQIVFPSREEAEAAFAAHQGGRHLRGDRGGAEHPARRPRARHLREIRDDRPGGRRCRLRARAGRVSGPVQGRFGTVMVRVTRSSRSGVEPYEEVAAEVRREHRAREARRNAINDVHDKVEDQRASAQAAAGDREGAGPAARRGRRARSLGPGQGRRRGREPARTRRAPDRRSSAPTSASTTRRCARRTAAMSGTRSKHRARARPRVVGGPRRGRRAMAGGRDRPPPGREGARPDRAPEQGRGDRSHRGRGR